LFLELDHTEGIGVDPLYQTVYAVIKCNGVERVDGFLEICFVEMRQNTNA
jgi:hypothetical protein